MFQSSILSSIKLIHLSTKNRIPSFPLLQTFKPSTKSLFSCSNYHQTLFFSSSSINKTIINNNHSNNNNNTLTKNDTVRSIIPASESFVNSFRFAMTTLASPAVILTSAKRDPATGELKPRGLTVSSFASLSIKPWPLVTFNIQVPSHAADSMRPSNNNNNNTNITPQPTFYAINILPATSAASKTCRAFAGGLGRDINPFTHPSISPYISFNNTIVDFDNLNDSSSNLNLPSSKSFNELLSEIPVYKHAKAVLYCTQHMSISVEDHEIWVSKVLHVKVMTPHDPKLLLLEKEEQGGDDEIKEILKSASASALVYQNRRFHCLGDDLSE